MKLQDRRRRLWGVYVARNGQIRYGNETVALLTDILGCSVVVIVVLLVFCGRM
jgi:hypothetical protein